MLFINVHVSGRVAFVTINYCIVRVELLIVLFHPPYLFIMQYSIVARISFQTQTIMIIVLQTGTLNHAHLLFLIISDE